MRLSWLVLIFSSVMAAQPRLEFAADLGLEPLRVLLNGPGSVVVGSTTQGGQPFRAAETASYGGSTYQTILIPLEKIFNNPQRGIDTPFDATFDSAGNLWIVGETTSDDITLVKPIVSKKVPYRQSGFILEIDRTGNILFETYLGGQGACQLNCVSYASTVTADSSGNVYIGGTTDESDFPSTPGSFLPTGPNIDTYGNTHYYSFVVKVSGSGNLVYSTFLGTGQQKCMLSPGLCLTASSTSSRVDSLVADSSGAVTAAESMSEGPGRITRLSADGTKAIWQTDTGITVGGIVRVLAAQDSSGVVTLFGASAPLANPLDPRNGNGPPTLFVQRIDTSGMKTSTFNLGQASGDTHPAGIALDAAGNVWLNGTDSSTAGALSGGAGQGADFLLELDPTTTNPLSLLRFFRGTVAAGLAIDTQQNKLIPGAKGALLTVPANYSPTTPMLTGFANAASFELNTGAYPSALISLIGIGFHGAPETVQIGEVAAPVLYAGPNQINVQVPYEAIAGRVDLSIPAENISMVLPVRQSLGVFTSDGSHAAAVNQDGTVNSAANPAAMGSVVSIYGTGAVWPYGLPDGTIATAAAWLNQEKNGFQILDGPGIPQTILYAGAAPGLIDGVFQINLMIPMGVSIAPDGAWQVQLQSVTGTTLSSNAVRIYIH